MIKKLSKYFILILFGSWASAQKSNKIHLPQNLGNGYSRIYITHAENGNLEKTIQKEEWAKEVLSGIHDKTGKYYAA